MTHTTETLWGTVEFREQGVSVEANSGQLWAWAHRDGAHWPCSELARDEIDSVRAGFDAHGLVDLVVIANDGYVVDLEGVDIPHDELTAWTSDALRAADLAATHPAHYVTVGQFS